MTSPDGRLPTQAGMLQILWTSKAWRLLAILLVHISGLMLMVPLLPGLVTDDFASRRAGERLKCDDIAPSLAPAACINAHADAVWWSTITSFFQSTIFSLLLTPAVGAWSDVHGRKPVILLAQGLACLPYTIVLLNIHADVPLTWYYVISAFTGAFSTIAPSLSYIADVTPPPHRAGCFGLILASFSLALIIGPPIGAMIPLEASPLATIAVVLCCMVATSIYLPESLDVQCALEAKRRFAEEGSRFASFGFGVFASTWRSLKILKRSALFLQLTLVLMISAVVSEGLQDLLLQYLKLKLAFQAVDIGQLFIIFGIGALLVQSVLLRPLLRACGERKLLVLGLVAGAIQQGALALAVKKWHALTAISFGCLGTVTFPTISSIKSNAAGQEEQGAVQGALYGARSLASGLGPIAFAALFAAFTRPESILPYYPGAPFILGMLLIIAAAAAAWRLPTSDAAVPVAEYVFVGQHDDEPLDVDGLINELDDCYEGDIAPIKENV